MQLGYVSLSGSGQTDDLITRVVGAFATDGLRIAGTVRASARDRHAHPCDIALRVLPDGPKVFISQPLGSAASGCRLDCGAIENIAVAVEARVPDADILIVNKFGKLEGKGRGLCPAVLMALERRIPVLVGVGALDLEQFLTFSGGVARRLPPDANAIRTWFEETGRGPVRIGGQGPHQLSERMGYLSVAGLEPGQGGR